MSTDHAHTVAGTRLAAAAAAAAFVISLLATVFSGWQTWQMHDRLDELTAKHVRIAENIGRIMQFDEVLTMSARMAAATGDFSYEKRYDQYDPQLTTAIDGLRAALPQAEIALFISETDEANNALVKIERQAFALTHQGRRQEATALLTGDEYLRLKKVYAGGMEKTVNTANSLMKKDVQHFHILSVWSVIVNAVMILVLLVAWITASKSARSWVAERRESADALQKSHDELEVRVEQRTADLLSTNEQLQHEIAERKQAEEALRISALKHKLLFESSRDALMTLAPPSWKFTSANQATLQLFGASSVAEFTALGPWNVSPELQPDGRPSGEKAQEAIMTAMREGSHFFEWEHQRLDVQPFAADVLLTRMKVGEDVFLQATVRDITERKRAQAEVLQLNAELEQKVIARTASLEHAKLELEQASRGKDEFLAAISHELKTPLNHILGFSDLLKEGLAGELNAEQKGMAQDIFAAGSKQLAIVNSLIELARLQAGKVALQAEPEDPAKLLADIAMRHAAQAQTVGLAFNAEVAQGLGEMPLDREVVTHLLDQLLENAFKFTPSGGKVSLTARRVPRADVASPVRSEAGEYLELAVADNGPGIAPEILPRLFQPFVQGDGRLARSHGGTGIGLMLVRLLAELHGGGSGVESKLGIGTKFMVWLPYGAAETGG